MTNDEKGGKRDQPKGDMAQLREGIHTVLHDLAQKAKTVSIGAMHYFIPDYEAFVPHRIHEAITVYLKNNKVWDIHEKKHASGSVSFLVEIPGGKHTEKHCIVALNPKTEYSTSKALEADVKQLHSTVEHVKGCSTLVVARWNKDKPKHLELKKMHAIHPNMSFVLDPVENPVFLREVEEELAEQDKEHHPHQTEAKRTPMKAHSCGAPKKEKVKKTERDEKDDKKKKKTPPVKATVEKKAKKGKTAEKPKKAHPSKMGKGVEECSDSDGSCDSDSSSDSEKTRKNETKKPKKEEPKKNGFFGILKF